MPAIPPSVLPLLASNVFMTFAWYGHPSRSTFAQRGGGA
jgi:uncharacterized protein (DUF486 family)